MKFENFLFDVCHSACIMYEESRSYHFLHRSFQEYFFACYYAMQDDNTLRKLGKHLETDGVFSGYDDLDAFFMLYTLAPEKVERFILLPFLESIFSGDSERDEYLFFLRSCFDEWLYCVMEDSVINEYCLRGGLRRAGSYADNDTVSSSPILSWILQILKIDPTVRIGDLGDEFKYPEH